jgi:hypothetical protein
LKILNIIITNKITYFFPPLSSEYTSIAKFAFIGGALTEAMGLFALVLGLILIF